MRLPKEAQVTLPGIEREKLIRQARKAEAAARYGNGFRIRAAATKVSRRVQGANPQGQVISGATT